MSNTRPLVTGLFPDRASAKAAYSAAEARGYTANDMNMAMSDNTRKTHFTASTAGKETELGNKAAEGAGIGCAIGGTIGAIAAAAAAVAVGTSIALPGPGLVIASPIAAVIVGAGAGAGAAGGILMGLQTRDDADAQHLETAWKSYNGQHVYR